MTAAKSPAETPWSGAIVTTSAAVIVPVTMAGVVVPSGHAGAFCP